MDMKIAGSGNICPGEYDNIKISGSGRIEGPIRCKKLNCSGAVHCHGEAEASEKVSISGSGRIEGDLRSAQISIAGSGRVDGNCSASDYIDISGAFRCDGNLKANKVSIAGSGSAASIEAEEVKIDGVINCSGLINAERIDIKIDGTGSEVESIGGSIIEIKRKRRGECSIFSLFRKKDSERRRLNVKSSIEGDEIEIDHVTADTVVGRVVSIGAGCKIRQVQYGESITVDPDAEVAEQVKI